MNNVLTTSYLNEHPLHKTTRNNNGDNYTDIGICVSTIKSNCFSPCSECVILVVRCDDNHTHTTIPTIMRRLDKRLDNTYDMSPRISDTTVWYDNDLGLEHVELCLRIIGHIDLISMLDINLLCDTPERNDSVIIVSTIGYYCGNFDCAIVLLNDNIFRRLVSNSHSGTIKNVIVACASTGVQPPSGNGWLYSLSTSIDHYVRSSTGRTCNINNGVSVITTIFAMITNPEAVTLCVSLVMPSNLWDFISTLLNNTTSLGMITLFRTTTQT